MKLLTELLRYERLDPPAEADPSTGDVIDNISTEDDLLDNVDDTEQQTNDNPELDSIADDAVEDPNRQGLIRTVRGAHLVYKRETDEGTFEELWIYNSDDLRKHLDVKKAILAGTDIPINANSSEDGTQTYELWSVGNVEMLLISGLPS